MDLRRVRVRLTILNGVMFAMALALVSVLAIRSASSQIQTSAEREGETRISEILPSLDAARGIATAAMHVEADAHWAEVAEGEDLAAMEEVISIEESL